MEEEPEDGDFREYLQSKGAEQALWNILIEMDKMKNKPENPVEYIRENLSPELTKQFTNLKMDIHLAEEEFSQLANEYPKQYRKFLKWKQKRAQKLAKGAKKGAGKNVAKKETIAQVKITKTLASVADSVSVNKNLMKSPKKKSYTPSVISKASKTSISSKVVRSSIPSKTLSQRKISNNQQEETIQEVNPHKTPIEESILEVLLAEPLPEIVPNTREIHGDVPSQSIVPEGRSSILIMKGRKVEESPQHLGHNFAEEQSYEIKSADEIVNEKRWFEEEKNDLESSQNQNKWWKCC